MNKAERWRFEVIEVKNLGNGTSEVSLELSDDFVTWFKKDQGLQRWSTKRFNVWFKKVLHEAAEPKIFTNR